MAKKKTPKRSNGQAAKKKPAPPENRKVPIAREFPAGHVGVAANDFVIQDDQSEFHLLFFQTHPPMVFGETESERRQAIEDIKAVRSVCVGRIIVSADRLPSFILAMQKHLGKYALQHGKADAKTKGAKDDT